MAQKGKVTLIIQARDLATRVLHRVNAGMAKLGQAAAAAAVAGGTLAVVLGGAFARSVIKAADTTEQLRLRLNALLGSTEEGGKAFKEMAAFAATVPFAYEEIMAGAAQLAGVVSGGAEEIAAYMPMIADLAAVSGLSIAEATDQVVRLMTAGAGAARLFRERGILAMLGFQAGVQTSAEQSKRMLIDAFLDPESQFRGASQRMASTWTGIMSMFGDRWFAFRNLVADAGFFDAVKDAAQGLLDRVDALVEGGQFDMLATAIGTHLGGAITWVMQAAGDLVESAARNGEVWLEWGKLVYTTIKAVALTLWGLARIAFNVGQVIGNALRGGVDIIIANLYNSIQTKLIDPINGFLDALDAIPMVDIEWRMGGLPVEQKVAQAQQDVDALKANLGDIRDTVGEVGGLWGSAMEQGANVVAAQMRASTAVAQEQVATASAEAQDAAQRLRDFQASQGGGLGQEATSALGKLDSNLAAISAKAQLVGSDFDATGARVKAYATFIDEAVRAGLDANTMLGEQHGTLGQVVQRYQQLQGQAAATKTAEQEWADTLALANQVVNAATPELAQLEVQQRAVEDAFIAGELSLAEYILALEHLGEATRDAAESGTQELESFASGAKNTMTRMGADLIMSLASGARSAKDVFLSAMKSILSAGIQLGLNILLFGSPSKLTMGWGHNIVMGMVVGMKNAEGQLVAAWHSMVGVIQQPQLQLATAGLAPPMGMPMQGALGSTRAERGQGELRLRLEGPEVPAPTNPLAAARDREWQRFYRETSLVAQEDGFRGQ